MFNLRTLTQPTNAKFSHKRRRIEDSNHSLVGPSSRVDNSAGSNRFLTRCHTVHHKVCLSGTCALV